MKNLGNAFDYNSRMLHPNSDEMMQQVLAGQKLNLTLNAEPSPWLDALGGKETLLEWTRVQLEKDFPEVAQVLGADLEAIRTKKVGQQGQAITVDESLRILERYDHPDTATASIEDFVYGIEGAYSLAHKLLDGYAWKGLPTDQDSFRIVLGKDPSNTGWRGYTTANSRNPSFLAQFRKGGAHYYPGEVPMVMGARHACQKYRGIFGGAPEHLWCYNRALEPLLTSSLKGSSCVSYHSEIDTAMAVEAFRRRNTGKALYGVGCDFSTMDVWHTYHLCRDSAKLYASMKNVPDDEVTEIVGALHTFYRLPVLALDGNVYAPSNGFWSTLSGIGPTNGGESVTNILIHSCAYSMAVNRTGVRPDYLLKVMGDDSASFFAAETESDVRRFAEVYVDCFMVLSAALGLKANAEKQEMSSDGIWYCKRFYPLRDIQGLSRRLCTTTHLPTVRLLAHYGVPSVVLPNGRYCARMNDVTMPFYPVERVVNSLVYPERPIVGRRTDCGKITISAEEMRSALGVLNNGWFDKRTRVLTNRMKQILGDAGESLVRAAAGMLDDVRFSSWRRKVYDSAELYVASAEVIARFLGREETNKLFPDANH